MMLSPETRATVHERRAACGRRPRGLDVRAHDADPLSRNGRGRTRCCTWCASTVSSRRRSAWRSRSRRSRPLWKRCSAVLPVARVQASVAEALGARRRSGGAQRGAMGSGARRDIERRRRRNHRSRVRGRRCPSRGPRTDSMPCRPRTRRETRGVGDGRERSRPRRAPRTDGRAVHSRRDRRAAGPSRRAVVASRREHRPSAARSPPSRAEKPEPLADAFPMLRPRLDPNQRALLLQPCSEIRIDRFTDSGRISEPQRIIVDGRHDLLSRRHRTSDRCSRSSRGSSGSRLPRPTSTRSSEIIAAKRVKELRAAIRKAPDDASRLLLAVGADVLRARMSRAVLDSVETIEGELDDDGIAELALVLHGAQVLQEYSDVLEERGLEPPQRWAGSRAAVAFARRSRIRSRIRRIREQIPRARSSSSKGPPRSGRCTTTRRSSSSEIRELAPRSRAACAGSSRCRPAPARRASRSRR